MFEAIEITASGIKFHVDSIELQIRLVMYLYVDGQLKEAYNHFEDVLDKEFNAYPLLFDIMPSLENDTTIKEIIEQKRPLE